MKERRILIAGNWKMNKTVAEAIALVDELKQKSGIISKADVVVCPPFTALPAVVEELQKSSIGVGAQNVHWAESGAYTGEVSAAMLRDIGVRYAIIGHSERRQYFGETDETVNKRLQAALAAGLTPIVCVGESLEQRENGEMASVVTSQLKADFAGLSSEDMESVIVAYEPIWAIGTGKTATPEQAQEVHALIRNQLRESFKTVADGTRILYGGSVKAANATELLNQADIDGALVGGASLKADDFLGIIEKAS